MNRTEKETRISVSNCLVMISLQLWIVNVSDKSRESSVHWCSGDLWDLPLWWCLESVRPGHGGSISCSVGSSWANAHRRKQNILTGVSSKHAGHSFQPWSDLCLKKMADRSLQHASRTHRERERPFFIMQEFSFPRSVSERIFCLNLPHKQKSFFPWMLEFNWTPFAFQRTDFLSDTVRLDVNCSLAENWVELDAVSVHGGKMCVP